MGSASPTPEQLLAMARSGEPEALGQLLGVYRNYLGLFARMHADVQLRTRVSPSDFVQETFLKACRHFHQFRGQSEAEFGAWLRRIFIRCVATAVERELISGKRAAGREIPLGRYLSNLERSADRFDAALISPHSSPSEQAQRRERVAQVADELARLPEQYREVIVLRNLEGHSFEEVGRRMGRSPGAVRILWLRALARWRQTTELEDSP